MREMMRDDKPKSEFEERVVSVDRVSYTVAGGRRLRFRALVVVGNRQGRVGMGVAKAGEVALAVQKAVTAAKKALISVPIVHETIPHSVVCHFGSAHVLLKPARAGTSVIAGGSIRPVIELAGIKNIRTKSLGSNNKINNISATLKALSSLRKLSARPAPVITTGEPSDGQTVGLPPVVGVTPPTPTKAAAKRSKKSV